MIVKLLTEHHLEFLSLKGGCRGSSESALVKMAHCWKSHALAQISTTHIPLFSCADPESFLQEGSNSILTVFYFSLCGERERIQIQLKAGHKWHFLGGPMMAQQH